jgi:hypothetical protein
MEPSAFNPYAAPDVQTLQDYSLPSDQVAIRRQFIHCESNIKSIAGLTILGGLLVLSGFGLATVYLFTGSDGDFCTSIRAVFLLAGTTSTSIAGWSLLMLLLLIGGVILLAESYFF